MCKPSFARSLNVPVAAFDFNFGALDDDLNEISKAYNNMLYVSILFDVASDAL